MVFVFDENYSNRLAQGLNHLEHGNKKSKADEIWHIKDLAEELQIKPEDGSSFSDEEVIVIAGKKKGIVITQDNDFKRTKHYHHLYKEHNVGAIIFSTYSNSKGYWNMVTSIINEWYELKQKMENKSKPFCFVVSKKGIQEYKF